MLQSNLILDAPNMFDIYWKKMNERILYKTKSTGCLLDFIQTNDDSLYISTFWKQLMYLDTSLKKTINKALKTT